MDSSKGLSASPARTSTSGMRIDIHDLTSQMGQRSMGTTSGTNSPLSSAPPTPGLKTPLSRRTSQLATSPLTASKPNPLRRASSSMSMGRPSSSPNPRKLSRSSTGGLGEDEKRPTPKRSISNLIAGLREAQTTMESIEEPIPLTAPQIAAEHFTRELLGHAQPESQAETVVILHDACYGHRWSRLKTTKSTLSMIVERPERIHASALGAAAAYVRLGGHHAGAKNAPHPDFTEVASPPFKVRRSARSLDITSSFVTNVHGTSWMAELRRMCQLTAEKLAAGAKEVSRSPLPGEQEKRKLHDGDLYLAPESLDAFQGALGGVADAIDAVFSQASSPSRAFVAVRPPGHHCSADHPSGFCWLNNVHVGIEYAAQTYGLTHAAILDFDLHHGDGSQSIAWQRNSKNEQIRLMPKPSAKSKPGPDIGYYSLHDINSYPCEMGDDEKVQAASLCIENAHGQSIWNVHLQPWKTEAEFWELYEERYKILLDKAKRFLQHHTARVRSEGKLVPRAAVFISAGFDASEWEGQGMQRHKVCVPTEFYARFTREVVELAQDPENGCDGRVISVLEGGYSDRALCSGVLSHLSGLCAVAVNTETKGVGSILGLSEKLTAMSIEEKLSYDKSWWSAANLTALEMKVYPQPPPPPGKKVRTGPQPTYATPTESFAYKVINADKFARSISGTMREAPMPVRPPTPPAPEVDWVVATQELSNLLVPTDRQTKSCTAEELGGVRMKKEQPVAVISVDDGAKPRQLRDRKSKAPGSTASRSAVSAQSEETEPQRSVSRSSRRETIAVLPSEEPAPAARRASRRLSAGSALSFATAGSDIDMPPVPALPKTTKIQTNGPSPKSQPAAAGTGMQVKKTRAPAKPRQQPAKPANPTSSINHLTHVQAQSDASNAPAPSTLDVDALASGLKKVTLKVSGSKEEHDRKQKEKVDAERRARGLKAAETRRANLAKKAAAPVPAQIPQVTASGDQMNNLAQQTPAFGGSEAPATVSTSVVPETHSNAGVEHHGNSQVQWWNSLHNTVPGSDVLDSSDMPSEALDLPAYDMNVSTAAPTTQPPSQMLPAASNILLAPFETQQAQPGSSKSIDPPTSPVRNSPTRRPSTAGGTPKHVSNGSVRGSPFRSPSGRPMPVWNSTGPIPFAAANAGSPKAMPKPGVVWKHQRPSAGVDADGNGVGATMLGGDHGGDIGQSESG